MIENDDVDSFMELRYNQEVWDGIFYRIFGWPEGCTYCWVEEYTRLSAFPGFRRWNLDDMKKYVADQESKQLS